MDKLLDEIDIIVRELDFEKHQHDARSLMLYICCARFLNTSTHISSRT
mgnify:CR=1 FL=1